MVLLLLLQLVWVLLGVMIDWMWHLLLLLVSSWLLLCLRMKQCWCFRLGCGGYHMSSVIGLPLLLLLLFLLLLLLLLCDDTFFNVFQSAKFWPTT